MLASSLMYAIRKLLLPVIILLLLPGCILVPRGRAQERERLRNQQGQFAQPVEKREIPPLPTPAGWEDVLRRAFLANGDLEASYDQWRAAVARIDQAASWPNSNGMVTYNYLFSGGNIKSWDRTTLGATFDPSVTLQFPTKTRQAGKVALEEARAAAEHFRRAKFDLQRRVLDMYYELALMEEQLRIQQDNVDLLGQLVQSARSRVEAGSPQQDLLKVQIEYRLAQNELATMQAQVKGRQAVLNAVLCRIPEEPLELPANLPPPRQVASDDRLIALGVTENPELAELAHQVAGRKEALELARLRYIPDIVPQISFTGSIAQNVGAGFMLPTNIPAIRGAISEAQAMLDESRATSRQMRLDRAASFIAALYFMRNAEQQTAVLEQEVLPLAQEAMTSSLQAYAAGTVSYSDLIDTQRTLLNLRLLVAQVRTEREKRLVELEALAGADVETLQKGTTNTE